MLLTNAYDPDPRVRQEALALAAMGCRVRILAWDRDRKAAVAEVVDGIEIERVDVRSTHGRGATQIFYYARVYAKMLWRGLRTRFDVVHCHDLDTLPAGILLGKLKRTPVVYDAHESFPDMLKGSIPEFVQRCLEQLERVLVRRVDLLITVGEKLRGRFVEFGARRSVVVGNWKRIDDFMRSASDNQRVRDRLGVPQNALMVVCITQLLKDRKIEELLAAVRNRPGVWVVIGGTGAMEQRVREAAAANPRVIYVGFARSKEIADYTCAADVVYYGFDPHNPNARYSAPNKLYEALAAGRPLITGDFGEIAEVVRESQCGIVLPEYSAPEIQKALDVMSDPQAREPMAENASRCGKTSLNWERGEAILHAEYRRFLPALRPRPARAPSCAAERAGQ